MAKITRIKASDSPRKEKEAEEATITRKKVVVKDKKQEKSARKSKKVAEKSIDSANKNEKKPFILIRPFVYLIRYIRGAWHELRQVRWPSRKMTWKMVLGVLVYTAIFVAVISLLDLFLSWLFGLILGK